MALKTHPAVRATMLIRRPVDEVFNAFVDPSVTCRFWFSRASGPLAPGKTVTWYWDQYGVSGEVKVTAFEENRRIAIEWPSPVEWSFIPRGDSATFVSIVATGFNGTDDEQVAQALDSSQGFNLVLAACKAFLEHGVELGVVSDKDPDAAVDGSRQARQPAAQPPAPGRDHLKAVNLRDKLGLFSEHYRPRTVGTFNGNNVMVVKIKGPFNWHSHDDTDDFFLVLDGRMRIELRDGTVELGPGEMYVVPRGVEHRPTADEEAHILLIEPAGTPNTGDPATAAPVVHI